MRKRNRRALGPIRFWMHCVGGAPDAIRRAATVAAALVLLSLGGSPVVAQVGAEQDELLFEQALQPWTGDLEGIKERGFLRFATAHNPLFLGAEFADQRGLAFDLARELENFLAEKVGKGQAGPIRVVVMPMARDAIIPAVAEGRADFAGANLTITAERSKVVAFSEPLWSEVRELVVTGPGLGQIASFDDLAASALHLRPSSSYFEHFQALNSQREAAGQDSIAIVEMDETLEDHDLLEMLDRDLLPAIVVDEHKAKVWDDIFENITVHGDLVVHEGGEIAWALRQDNPELRAVLNEFIATTRKGSLLGNILIKRYLKNKKWIKSVRSDEAMGRYENTIDLIKQYADQYDFDWLMIAAQGFQESGLDQSKRSPVGAIGIMQLMPATANDPVVSVGDVSEAEHNVHAGVKYLRHLRETYYDDDAIAPIDQVLFSFGAYNAGPGNMKKARGRAEKMGLDPNRWFNHVEIAAARSISSEPVTYVRNIYKYYVAYNLMERAQQEREGAEAADEN